MTVRLVGVDVRDIEEPWRGGLVVRQTPDGYDGFVVVPACHTEDELRLLSDWVLARLRRLAEPDGSEPDGWQVNEDGDRYIWARQVILPSLD